LNWTPTTARWIWLPGEERPANSYVQFRKAFILETKSASATVHVTADCRYLLSVNGAVVGRGPVVTHPKYKQVDVYEVGRLLRKGTNAIAVFVLQRHNPTMRLVPVRGGFLLQLDVVAALGERDNSFGTNSTWKARWAVESKSDTPFMTHQCGQQEWVDGRLVPVGWQQPDFDDSGWENAIEIASPEQFWPRELEVRRLPHLQYDVVHPRRLICFFGLTSWGEKDVEPARQIMTAYPMSSVIARNAESLLARVASAAPSRQPGSKRKSAETADTTPPAVFLEQQGDGVGLVLDLGAEMYGHPFVDFECPAGAVVNIGHGEVLVRNRVPTVLFPDRPPEQRYADRYITREGRQRFEIFDTKGCRYLEIHFNKLADFYKGAKVTIHEVGLIRSRTPMEMQSQFECSDDRLNQIWRMCAHSAEVLCQDMYINDAQREQNQWPDLIQTMLYLQLFGKIELVRHAIEIFCRTQLPSGFILPHYPLGRDFKSEDELYFCSTMSIPMLVYFDWLFQGEDDRQREWLECCAKVVEFLRKHIGPHGTVANLPGDPWIEWSGMDARRTGRGVENTWEVTVWNAAFVVVLEQLATMAESFGQTDRARAWRQLADSIRRAAIARYWSPKRNAYVDGLYDGQPSAAVSQTTNAWAVLARWGDEKRLRQILKTTEDPARYDVPSAINMLGIHHEALESLDLDRPALDRIRAKYGAMLDQGATTVWEAEEALERNMGLGFCFSAHPLNYLARTVLGVTPLAPGYRQFSVRIAPRTLKHARGKIATPRGYIEVAWQKKGKSCEMQITVPESTEADVAPPRMGSRVKAEPVITVDGVTCQLVPLQVGLCTFLRSEQPAVKLTPGKHVVVFS